MKVVIEIDGVRHRMVETENVCFCDGAMGTAKCSLLCHCTGANACASQANILKFCNMFPHKKYAHFETDK